MNKEERKAFFQSGLKTRAQDDGKKYIEGYFVVYNQETELWPGWFEQIAAGALDDSLKDNDIRCLFNHDSNNVMGRVSAGTLELKSDDYGLWGKVEINEADSMAMDVYARVSRGDITGCSFGFFVEDEEYRIENDVWHWNVLRANCFEVTICPFPAYPQTEIQAREKQKGQRLAMRRKALKTKLEGIKC